MAAIQENSESKPVLNRLKVLHSTRGGCWINTHTSKYKFLELTVLVIYMIYHAYFL